MKQDEGESCLILDHSGQTKSYIKNPQNNE